MECCNEDCVIKTLRRAINPKTPEHSKLSCQLQVCTEEISTS